MNEEMLDFLAEDGAPAVARILMGTGGIENKLEIEDLLLHIRKMEKDIDFFKQVKAARAAVIDAKIGKVDEQIEMLRSAILLYMTQQGETKVDFPGVAKVTTRKSKSTYVVEDQSAVESHLQKLNILKDVAEQIWKFDKKELNKTLDELAANNNLPSGIKIEPSKIAIAISFSKDGDAEKPRVKTTDADSASSQLAGLKI